MSNVNDEDVMVDEEVGVEEAPAEEAPAEEAPAEEAPAETKTMSVAGITFKETQFPLFIVLLASIVLMIATTAHDDPNNSKGGYFGYAISISAIAMILSFIGLLLTKFSEDMYAKFGKHMNMLCFIYSFVGACFLTFDKPFTDTGNGYFAAWTAVFGSAMAMGMTANAFGSTIKGLGAIMGLLASSLVVILASIKPIRDETYKSEAIYAMVLACVTFVFIILVMALDKRNVSMPVKAYFLAIAILAICWILAACIVTFRGPFDTTGNGYFGSWCGAATSSMAAFAAMNAM